MSKAIKDRMDLTLECIRRHYVGEDSPLANTLMRYSDFFDLFLDFKGYCNFFLLQDLVTRDYEKIEYFLPFIDFSENQMPKTVDEYQQYMQSNIKFLSSRNSRISEYIGD